MKKHFITYTLIILALMLTISSCGNTTPIETKHSKLTIVSTIYPSYDWTKEILGENAENVDLSLLIENGVDLHSYQPSVDDMLKVSNCDVFIYVGGQSDVWVEDAIKQATNPNMKVINLLDVLGETVKEEEIVDGMQEENDNGVEEVELDEHVWLSVKNAEILTKAIATAISEVDPVNTQIYEQNSNNYIAKLNELDEKYTNATETAKNHTLVFGDRFPLRYLVDDYNLDYFAAFPGCSAETEASFDTIVFLANKLDELKLNYIMTVDNSDKKIAQTISDNTSTKDKEILTLNSMQAVTNDDITNGASYLNIMEQNLATITKALN